MDNKALKAIFIILFISLAAVMVFPLPTPTSPPLAHRPARSVRQARHSAMQPPYTKSPQHAANASRPPLQNRSNFQEGGSFLEEQRAARRDEERERHAALQQTPSCRRRRVPRPNDENRPVSPTPRSSRSSQPANAPLPTPPDTQRAAGTQGEDNGQTNATNSGTAPYSTPPLTQTAPQNQGRQSAAPAAGPSRRSLAQLARQERERAQREQAALQQQQQARPAGAADPPKNPPPQPEQQQQPPDAGGPPAACGAATSRSGSRSRKSRCLF
ncbi:hypothetical protein R3P38DRAFT_2794668 [Favolaschia claudopus]|uniref:Uncharacterized protein n=1 Tax=Favolaschia claudopus TaxID=2862362 RepID=A0AAW0A8N6_9AGAR